MNYRNGILSSFAFCFALTACASSADAQEATAPEAYSLLPGKTVTATAPGKHSVTYHIFAPDDYKEDSTPMPLLVVFSPNGDGMALLNKLRNGANSAGWLLVGCDKLRNGMNSDTLETEVEDEVLNDVFQNIPHDASRVYLGGFSGGAMRAYGITARRTEPYAGVLAFGGWLGGPSYQDKPYRENMSVAMVTGVRDLGASGWVTIDTKTLRRRNCSVKHFAFDGGHSVSPPATTRAAIRWLDEQWTKKNDASKDTDKIPLEILYVGKAGPRADDFMTYLTKHFTSVARTSATDLTLEHVNHADVLLLDATVRSLPDGCTKAMLMTGSSAAMTGERYGSKIDWLCQCLDNEAYSVNTSHPIFQGPLPVTPTLVEKRCPHSKLKIQAWKVEEPQDEPGLVSSREHFSSARDSEIISGGVNMKGVSGVPLVREAHRLLWGFVAPPTEMTEEGRRAFVNALTWIHQFDGEVQREFAGLHERKTIKSVLDSPYVDSKNLNRWFPKSLIEATGGDKEAIRKHFENRMDYVHVPTGSGLLQIDRQAEQLKTPVHEPASIAKWIDMLDGGQSKLAFGLLQRYTRQSIRLKPKQWQEWFDSNRDQLVFVEDRGYRFVVRPNDTPPARVMQALSNSDPSETDLTEVSPVLFQRGLAGRHTIDGVAYQYAGWKITLVVRARAKDGWHFYSPTVNNGTNIPTEIQVELPDGMEFVGDWKIPTSEDGHLRDGATFQRVIRLGKQSRDRVEIKGSIRFQACTDQKCLRPQTLNFSLPLIVMARYLSWPAAISQAQDWEAEAKARIEKHRMADMVIAVTDENGDPVPGLDINVKLKEHAFTWAANIQQNLYDQRSTQAENYRRMIEDLGVNGVTQTTYWNSRWSSERHKQTIEEMNQLFHDHGFRVRCHPVLYPRWRTIPAKVEAMDIEDARLAVDAHVRELSTRMSGKYTDWDVVNESLNNEEWLADMGGEDALHEWFRIVREEAPTVNRYINETGIIYNINLSKLERYVDRISGLKENGLVDGVGVQGHFNGTDTPEEVYEILETLAQLDLPIRVTEMDLSTTDLAKHAEEFKDYLTILFSHPSVVGITLWGFWDGHMWNDRPGLYTRDFRLTPTGKVWMELVQGEWTTDVTEATDANGRIATRGFLGDYEITVTSSSGTSVVTATLPESGLDLTMTLVDGVIASPTK